MSGSNVTPNPMFDSNQQGFDGFATARRKTMTGTVSSSKVQPKLQTLMKLKSLSVLHKDKDQDYVLPKIQRNIFGTYNNAMYQVPMVNIFWAFVDGSAEPPLWSTLSSLLEALAITNALVLALVCAFYSAVDFTEIEAAKYRYMIGDWQSCKDWHLVGGPNGETKCPNMEIKFWGGDTTSNVTVAGGGDDWNYYRCQIPCFQDRPIDGDGTLASGGYAMWWHFNRYNSDDGKRFNAPGIIGHPFDASKPIELTDWYSPIDMYNADAAASAMLLSLALLLSVVVLVAGAPNTFAHSEKTGRQFSTVMRTFMWWVRWVLALIMGATILGVFLYFQCLKDMVFLKFSDDTIERTGDWGGWLLSGPESTYGWSSTSIIWLCYAPLAIGFLMVSLGQRAAYQYPRNPAIDFAENLRTHELYRGGHAKELVDFLNALGVYSATHEEIKNDQGVRISKRYERPACNVPFLPTEDMENCWTRGSCVATGVRFVCCAPTCIKGLKCESCYETTREEKTREEESRKQTYEALQKGSEINEPLERHETIVYLSAAGGESSSDAEVVADVLIDNGIDTVQQLIQLVSVDPSRLFDMDGIDLGVALAIVVCLQEGRVEEQTPIEHKGKKYVDSEYVLKYRSAVLSYNKAIKSHYDAFVASKDEAYG